MKKIILLFTISLFIVGCGSDDAATFVDDVNNNQDNDCYDSYGDLESDPYQNTHNSLDLSWYGPSLSDWEIQFGLDGFNVGSGVTIGEQYASTGVTVENLQADTAYDFYLRQICDNGVPSNWKGPLSLTTKEVPFNENCTDPIDFSLYDVGIESFYWNGTEYFREYVRLSWYSDGPTSFEVSYGTTGFNINDGIILNTSNSNPKITSGIGGSTTYDFYVRAYCGADGYSDWIGPVIVSTP